MAAKWVLNYLFIQISFMATKKQQKKFVVRFRRNNYFYLSVYKMYPVVVIKDRIWTGRNCDRTTRNQSRERFKSPFNHKWLLFPDNFHNSVVFVAPYFALPSSINPQQINSFLFSNATVIRLVYFILVNFHESVSVVLERVYFVVAVGTFLICASLLS